MNRMYLLILAFFMAGCSATKTVKAAVTHRTDFEPPAYLVATMAATTWQTVHLGGDYALVVVTVKDKTHFSLMVEAYKTLGWSAGWEDPATDLAFNRIGNMPPLDCTLYRYDGGICSEGDTWCEGHLNYDLQVIGGCSAPVSVPFPVYAKTWDTEIHQVKGNEWCAIFYRDGLPEGVPCW